MIVLDPRSTGSARDIVPSATTVSVAVSTASVADLASVLAFSADDGLAAAVLAVCFAMAAVAFCFAMVLLLPVAGEGMWPWDGWMDAATA